ncbi:hypothetical protein [uncultured Gilvimarinus sp.]|uniref:hypothetical protein n=1 Tax=uncultured Gilvimarinus sp. TaxID=1689143 RepID=UPI0030EB749D
MKKRLFPLAMLAGLAGASGSAIVYYIGTACSLLFDLLRPCEADQFEAELVQARQAKVTSMLPARAGATPGTSQAREFVTMLRGIGSGSREGCLA